MSCATNGSSRSRGFYNQLYYSAVFIFIFMLKLTSQFAITRLKITTYTSSNIASQINLLSFIVVLGPPVYYLILPSMYNIEIYDQISMGLLNIIYIPIYI